MPDTPLWDTEPGRKSFLMFCFLMTVQVVLGGGVLCAGCLLLFSSYCLKFTVRVSSEFSALSELSLSADV